MDGTRTTIQGEIKMNPILYVTQVTVTPTPVPTIEMINQWYIGGVGPLEDGQIVALVLICLVIAFVLVVIFQPRGYE